MSTLAVLLGAVVLVSAPVRSCAQDGSNNRRIVDRVTPDYPLIARHMGLAGSVKIDALVAPDGRVKEVDIKGGHPVLAQSAALAVRHWKWEPAAHETHELVEIKFAPQ
jgi:TonB family protein